MRNKTIQYGVDRETGLIFSRVGDEVYYPVLDFEHMKPENGYEQIYTFEKDNISKVLPYSNVKWTRKIDLVDKNFHRKLWGMKPISPKPQE